MAEQSYYKVTMKEGGLNAVSSFNAIEYSPPEESMVRFVLQRKKIIGMDEMLEQVRYVPVQNILFIDAEELYEGGGLEEGDIDFDEDLEDDEIKMSKE